MIGPYVTSTMATEQVEAESLHAPEYEEELEEIRHDTHPLTHFSAANFGSRRYEDFTTIGIRSTLANSQIIFSVTREDWIEDSMVERNRRLRKEHQLQQVQHDLSGELNLTWIWAQTLKAARAGQVWFVVTLAGALLHFCDLISNQLSFQACVLVSTPP